MRIAFDVSPLSHERTGVNNYIRGSLTGLAEVAGERGHEIVAFAPTSPAGKRAIPEAVAGLDVELKLASLPGAHGWRTAWSVLGHPAAERWLGPFDVLHFTDWMYPPQRDGVRATTIHDLVPLHHPQWTTKRTQAMHGRKYRNAARTCDVVFANSAFTADDFAETLGFPRERVLVASPGVGAEYTTEGEAAELGAPYLLTVATLEPRKNLGTLVDAFALLGDTGLSLVVAGGAGWGEQPELDRPGIVRLGRVTRRRARPSLSRRRRSRLPVEVRRLRHADHRGDGLRRAGRRIRPPVDGRGRRRRRGARRSREPAGDRRRDSRGGRAPRRVA